MSKLNIYDLCSVLVAKNGLDDKESHRFIKAMFDIIQEGLDEDKIVKVKGLGTFKIIEVDDRESINVNTGERVLIEGHSKLTFTPDSVMKEIVNKPFSQFETVILNEGVDFPEPAISEESAISEERADNTSELSDASELSENPGSSDDSLIDNSGSSDDSLIDNSGSSDNLPSDAPIVEFSDDAPNNINEESAPSDESPVESSHSDESPVESPQDASSIEESPQDDDSSESPSPIEEDDSEEDDSEEDDSEEDDSGNSPLRWILASVVILLLILGAAYGGYLYGRYEISEEMAYKQMKADLKTAEMTAKKAEAAMAKDSASQQVDATKIGAMSIDKESDEADKEKSADEVKKDEAKDEVYKKEQAPKAETVKQQPAKETTDKYEAKDARVRTGAYRIIGEDRTIKAKAGQTVEDIATRALGPGMSCYVEVFNSIDGKTALKEGQIIKIPKLELKKRR